MQLVLKNHQGTIFSIHFQKAHVKAAVETTYLLRSQLFLHLKKNAGPKKDPLETGIFLAEKQRLPSYVASKKLTGIRLYKVGPYQVVKSRVKNIILLIMEWIFTPSYPFISQHYRGYKITSYFYLQLVGAPSWFIYLFSYLWGSPSIRLALCTWMQSTMREGGVFLEDFFWAFWHTIIGLGGGLKHFLFSPLSGEMIQFD